MPCKEGVVLDVKDNGLARVVTRREQACAECGSSTCCPAMGSVQSTSMEAFNRAGAGVGDSVTVSFKHQSPVKSAAILYLIPTAGLVAGLVSSSYLSNKGSLDESSLSMIFSLAGFVLGLMISFLINAWLTRFRGYAPEVTQILCRASKGASSTLGREPGPDHSLMSHKGSGNSRQGGRTCHSCDM